MPVNKNAFKRYQIIDQVIRNRGYATKDQIMNQVRFVMGIKYSEKQFYLDIKELQNSNPSGKKDLGWCCPIDQDAKGRYFYTDPEFSLTRITFTTPDRLLIEAAQKALKNLKGFPLFQDLTKLLERLSKNISIELDTPTAVRTDMFVDFESRDYKGIEYLNILINCAALRYRVHLRYKDYFHKKSISTTIEPYLLKEYKNRWYCIGKIKGEDDFHTFSLDRIISLQALNRVEDVQFEVDSTFVKESYFKYAYGITTPNNFKPQFKNSWLPQLIKLEFDAIQKEYIKALPLHHSQKILRETSQSMIVTIEVYITIELIKDLRSFGPRVKVLSPKNLLEDYAAFEVKHTGNTL